MMKTLFLLGGRANVILILTASVYTYRVAFNNLKTMNECKKKDNLSGKDAKEASKCVKKSQNYE